MPPADPMTPGPLRAVILDWAGTMIDHGSMGPVEPFLRVLRARGIEISPQDARGPMGRNKRDHLEALVNLPKVQRQWLEHQRAPLGPLDLDAMFEEFVALQMSCLLDHCAVLPGVLETIDVLRGRDLLIGSTTGYIGEMMAKLIPAVERQGLTLDAIVCASDVVAGRPEPWMALEAARRLRAYPMSAIVKIGDTPADVAEGRNAGMWTIGVAGTGNEVGLSLAEWQALEPDERAARLADARQRLRACGAHDVVDDLSEVPAGLRRIESRRRQGERP